MCKIRVEVEEGLIPAEKVVRIRTTSGPEEVAVASGLVSDGALMASFIGRTDDRVLIELPRETASGRWRVWVEESELLEV